MQSTVVKECVTFKKLAALEQSKCKKFLGMSWITNILSIKQFAHRFCLLHVHTGPYKYLHGSTGGTVQVIELQSVHDFDLEKEGHNLLPARFHFRKDLC